jgi:hypothetical protein
MAQFRVYTDEKITLWQRVGLVIEADSEAQAREILNDQARFTALMYDGGGEYNGEVDPYWETEEHSEWDNAAPTITKIGSDE